MVVLFIFFVLTGAVHPVFYCPFDQNFLTCYFSYNGEKSNTLENCSQNVCFLCAWSIHCLPFLQGLCMIIGGIKHQEQRFNSRSAGVGSALLFISVGGENFFQLFSISLATVMFFFCKTAVTNV